MIFGKKNKKIFLIGFCLSALSACVNGAFAGTAKKEKMEGEQRIENIDRTFLQKQSVDQIVLHYNPSIEGIDTDIRGIKRHNYKISGYPDDQVSEDIVEAYMNGNGPMLFSQDQVFSGTMAGTLMDVYDKIFGSPNP